VSTPKGFAPTIPSPVRRFVQDLKHGLKDEMSAFRRVETAPAIFGILFVCGGSGVGWKNQNLTRRANHRHKFIIAPHKPAGPEKPAAGFCLRFPEIIVRRRAGMAPTAAYLISLALTLLMLVVVWEGLS
jgi:hypothetical protein